MHQDFEKVLISGPSLRRFSSTGMLTHSPVPTVVVHAFLIEASYHLDGDLLEHAFVKRLGVEELFFLFSKTLPMVVLNETCEVLDFTCVPKSA